MTVTINRYIPDTEIEAAAVRVLQQYAQRRYPILMPPVPIEEIIEYTIDISLIWDAIPDREGTPVLAKIEARGQPLPEIAIIMNENKQLFFAQHEGVEQFSQAHELGHYVLHIDCAKLYTLLLPNAAEQSTVLCRADVDKQRDRKGWEREWQAERFAAYLLMPQDMVRRATVGVDLCQWPNLYRLKEQFHVTISALTRRLSDLRLITITDNRTILPYQGKLAPQSPSLWE